MTALYADTHPKMEALQIQYWRVNCSQEPTMQNEPIEVTFKVTAENLARG